MKAWEQFLKENYFDPKKPASYSGPIKIFRYLKSNGYEDVSYKDVVNWLKDQEVYSLHQGANKPKKRSRIVVEGIDSQWDIDLMDVGSLAKKNEGVKFLLTAIDLFSKYLFVRALKSKKADVVKSALESIFKKGGKRKICRFDQGKEFSNKAVEVLLKKMALNIFPLKMRQMPIMLKGLEHVA